MAGEFRQQHVGLTIIASLVPLILLGLSVQV